MARFDRLHVYTTILYTGMVPLYYHPDAEIACKIASALYEGGCQLLEFTNRGDCAYDVFRALLQHVRQECPSMILGVGSIEDAPTAALFLASGADFIVGPTFREEIARLCNRRKIAYIPGCSTVNEVATAEEWGAEIVKIFPGEAVGGASFVKSLLGPRPWSTIMVTGGVKTSQDNLREWFDAGVRAVGLGSGLIRQDVVDSGAFDRLAAETAMVSQFIRTLIN
ncbi:MAG: bifunctional 4-hydroxy-2-oxoglutarate aldolase/2-dehydro-3-deoxy-phosphogluconate aldolase [Chloroflexi bacterium]|nr:bifunctional 4-hydroxy-2-oxoglutarate aldolase/2-dehydro-3-deoxy-phosphogluconate aldolase [Chloroflexota bacterium]